MRRSVLGGTFATLIGFTALELIVVGLTIPLLLALTYLVQRTKAGKAMRATAQDQDASAMMGINVDRTISFTFALGGALAGAGGLIYALYVGTTNFQLGFRLGLYAFTAAVLEALTTRADMDGNGEISMLEMTQYVARRVPELTGNRQTPGIDPRFDGNIFVVDM